MSFADWRDCHTPADCEMEYVACVCVCVFVVAQGQKFMVLDPHTRPAKRQKPVIVPVKRSGIHFVTHCVETPLLLSCSLYQGCSEEFMKMDRYLGNEACLFTVFIVLYFIRVNVSPRMLCCLLQYFCYLRLQ